MAQSGAEWQLWMPPSESIGWTALALSLFHPVLVQPCASYQLSEMFPSSPMVLDTSEDFVHRIPPGAQ